LQEAYERTIEGWVRALDLRDRETEGHTQRVTELTLKVAQKLGFNDDELVHIRRGALLHDMGKMAIPDEILQKPGPLNEAEWEKMRRHPIYAYEMLSPISYLHAALDIPYSHHERWDGSGYPRGLKGRDIPISARLFAIVDVWDALSTDRPYRKRLPRYEVIKYLKEKSGQLFDAELVEVFLTVVGSEE
jgi:putative nucleotidyltransferase with HDIG domain